jgi:hypothetical protein
MSLNMALCGSGGTSALTVAIGVEQTNRETAQSTQLTKSVVR